LPTNWGVVLVTFPNRTRDEWSVPSAGWHYDFDVHANATEIHGLQVFLFFSSVEPRGGGTLLVEGSHRLLRHFASSLRQDEGPGDHQSVRRQFLRHDPWLRALTGVAASPSDRTDFFMREREASSGGSLRVVEMTGEPGDVILCHPLMLHVAARNAASVPRFMRSQRICTADPAIGDRAPSTVDAVASARDRGT
jgi:ectoine hydroxylase-related dioxygenase (phytanoyl-CoA dioxygenase family)